MDSLTITIVGGVVVVIIGLFIEYGIIQKRKQHRERNLLPQSENQDTLLPLDNNAKILPSPSVVPGMDLPWPDAVNKAVDSFRKIHPRDRVVIKIMNIVKGWAIVTVWVFSAVTRTYALKIDRSGDIVEVKDQS